MDGKSLDALERLGRLRKAGALSDDEFQAQKQAIFNRQSRRLAESNAVSSTVDQVGAASQDFLGASAATFREHEAVAPVWARKKRGLNTSGIVVLLALIFLATFGASMWLLNREDDPGLSISDVLGGSSDAMISPGYYSADVDPEVVLSACDRVDGYTTALAKGGGEDAIYDALLASAGMTFENMSILASAVDSGRVGISTSRKGERCVATLSAGAFVARCKITAVRVNGSKVALDRCTALTNAE